MAKVEISSPPTQLATGLLQLQNGVAMSATLVSVTDQNNTTSPLKLSTTLVQVVSTLKITTADNPYIDAEDSSGNNRFTIGRDPASQQVNVDFASNPTGSTTIVGAIRTYVDGVNLSEVMTFREDGNIGAGTNNPTAKLTINPTDFVIGANAGYSTYYGSAINGTIQATTSGATTQLWFRANGNALNENDNYWSRIEQVSGGAMRILSSRYGSLVLGNNGYNNAITLYNYAAMQMPRVGINNSTPTALLQITGTGSTSATTSLLVQNSGGVDMLRMQDNGDLTLGTFASGLGKIVVTCDPSYGTKTVMANNFGAPIIRQVSNDVLYFGGQQIASLIAIGYLSFNAPRIYGNTILGNSTGSSFNFFVNGSPYGQTPSTPSRGVLFDGGFAFQSGGYANYFELSPTYTFDISNNRIVKGIYYNPTLVTPNTNDKHYGIQTTSGGAYINTTTPQDSACLQADSTTQGFLPPRMTDAQIRAIASPVNGLVAFNTDINVLCCYQAGIWVKFSHSPM